MAKFTLYWRKNLFIGEKHYFIGENLFLLANWKIGGIFPNSGCCFYVQKKPLDTDRPASLLI
ncbi:MAG TPA: hypothetical protein DCR24_06305 [Bacillus bacterium]|nr:hypothetical protein [Bacillus sp. (in: firmicutes)]